MSRRDQSEARVRSLASYGLSARSAVRRPIPGHPARNPSGFDRLIGPLRSSLGGLWMVHGVRSAILPRERASLAEGG